MTEATRITEFAEIDTKGEFLTSKLDQNAIFQK